MSFFISSKAHLVAKINAANNTAMFTTTNLSFSPAAAVAGSQFEGQTDKNSFVVVSAASGASFAGRTTVFLNRADLGDLIHFRSPAAIRRGNAQTIHDLLPNILYYYGLMIGVEDVEDAVLEMVDGSGLATLVAKPGSLVWTGQVLLNVTDGGVPLPEVIVEDHLPGLNYPVEDPSTQISALLYVRPIDATASGNDLLTIPEGPLTGDDLTLVRDVLLANDQNVGKDLWNSSAVSTEWSLEGAVVVYNGENNPGLVTNPNFPYVLGLRLREDVTVPIGTFYLHYDLPPDLN